MGARYTKVVSQPYPDVKLTGFSIIELRSKMLGLSKTFNKSGVYFLTMDDVKYCFNSMTQVAMYRLFKQFDISGSMRIGSFDFWGALILTASDYVVEKVIFCLKLMDFNKSGYLAYNDILVLLFCVSRGVTCLKGYPPIPGDVIEKMIIDCFRSNKSNLSDTGEIAIDDFAQYMLADDYCIAYLSSLGVKAAPVDSNALVTKRCDLMRAAAGVKAEMSRILCDLEELAIDAEAYAKERGGDVKLLQMNPSEGAHVSNNTKSVAGGNFEADGNVISKALTEALMVDDGTAKAQFITAEHPSRKYFNSMTPFVDAEVFSEARAGRPVGTTRNIYGENFKKGLFTVWRKLPHTEDHMVHLDEFTLIKLFDNVGVTFSYPDARRCLQDIGCSQTGRYSFEAVLKWYRLQASTVDSVANAKTQEKQAAAAAAASAAAASAAAAAAASAAAATAAEAAASKKKKKNTIGSTSHSAAPAPVEIALVPSPGTSSAGPVNIGWKQFQLYVGTHYASLRKWYTASLSELAKQREALDASDRVTRDSMNKYHVPFIAHIRSKLAVKAGGMGLNFASTKSSGAGADSASLMNKLLAFRSTSQKKSSNMLLKYVFGDANDENKHCVPKQLPTREELEEQRREGEAKMEAKAAAAAAVETAVRSGPGAVAAEPGLALGSASRSTSRAGEARDMSPLKRINARKKSRRPPLLYAKKLNVEEMSDFDMHIKLHITSNPFTNLSTKKSKEAGRLKQTDELGKVIHDFMNVESQDVLFYFNNLQEQKAAISAAAAPAATEPAPASSKEEQAHSGPAAATATTVEDKMSSVEDSGPAKAAAEAAPPAKIKEFNSVAWLCFHMLPGSTAEQEQIVCQAVQNFFKSIPSHLTKHLYTDVEVDIFTVLPANSGKDMNSSVAKMIAILKNAESGGDKQEEEENAEPEHDRVVIVALLHEKDHLEVLERDLVMSDLFCSRALNSVSVDLQTTKSFSDILERSKLFHYYETQLFGPQEGELGEEGMNPLKFAKDVRQKKKEAKARAAKAPKLTREAMMEQCRELGMRDTGLGKDMAARLVPLYEQQAEQAGRGEMSEFASNLVDTIYKIFRKTEEDEEVETKAESQIRRQEAAVAGVKATTLQDTKGLKLWELNKLLNKTGTGTMYDSKEYKNLMNEHQLLVDRDDRLLRNGLKAYYRANGRLGVDNNAVGIGSMNDIMAGKLVISSQWEPDSLSSFLNLVGSNPLFIQNIIKYTSFLSILKDVKIDRRVECFGDIFEAFSTKLGLKLSKEVFNSPGWLSRFVSELSEFLADGSAGIIPSLRNIVLKRYGQFDQWEEVYLQKVPDAVDFEWENYVEVKNRRRMAAFAAKEAERLADVAAEYESAKQAVEASMQAMADDDPDVNLDLFKVEVEPPGGELAEVMTIEQLNEEEGYVESDEQIATDKAARAETIRKCVVDSLPVVITDPDCNLHEQLADVKEDMIFLSEIQSNQTIALPVELGILVAKRREKCLTEIARLEQAIQEEEVNQQAHICAAYDAIRMFTRSISNFGCGTMDLTVRGATTGCDWVPYVLPRAMGEKSAAKQRVVEKQERANKRRVAALAALEREKLRRNMTDEEKEALRQEKLALERKKWAVEEEQMLAEAVAALFEARNERKSSTETAEMVAKWEALLSIREDRYPNHHRLAVVMNDLACILLEFYGLDHPLCQPAGPLLQGAAHIIMKDVQVPAEPLPALPDLGHPPSRPTAASPKGDDGLGVSDVGVGGELEGGEEERIKHTVRDNIAYGLHITKIVATRIELRRGNSNNSNNNNVVDGDLGTTGGSRAGAGVFLHMRSGIGENITWNAHTNVQHLMFKPNSSTLPHAVALTLDGEEQEADEEEEEDRKERRAAAGASAVWGYNEKNGPQILVSDIEMDKGQLQATCLFEPDAGTSKNREDGVIGIGSVVYPKGMLQQIRLGVKSVSADVSMELYRSDADGSIAVGRVVFSLLYMAEFDLSKKKKEVNNTIHSFYVLKMIAKNFHKTPPPGSAHSLFLESGTKKYIRWSSASKFERGKKSGRVLWNYTADDPTMMNLLVTEDELKDSGRLKIVCVNGGTPSGDKKDVSWAADSATVVGSGEIKYPASMLADDFSPPAAAAAGAGANVGSAGGSQDAAGNKRKGTVHQLVVPMYTTYRGQKSAVEVLLYLSKDKTNVIADTVDAESNIAYHLHITKIHAAIKIAHMTNRKGGLYFLLKSGMANLTTWTSMTSVTQPDGGVAEWHFSATSGPHIVVTDAEMEKGHFDMKCFEETRKVKDPLIGSVEAPYPVEFLEAIRGGATNTETELEIKLLDKLGYSVGTASVTLLYAKGIDLPKTPDRASSPLSSRPSFTAEDFVTSTVFTFKIQSVLAKNLKGYKVGFFSLFLQSGTKSYTRWARATKYQSKGKDGLVTWKFAEQKDMNLIVAEEEFYSGGGLKVICVDANEEDGEDGVSWSGTPTVIGSGTHRYQLSLLETVSDVGQRAKTPTGSLKPVVSSAVETTTAAATPSAAAAAAAGRRPASAGSALSAEDQHTASSRAAARAEADLAAAEGAISFTPSTKVPSIIPLTLLLKNLEGDVTGEVVVNLAPTCVQNEIEKVSKNAKVSKSGRFDSFKSPLYSSTSRRGEKVVQVEAEPPPIQLSEEELKLKELLDYFKEEDETNRKNMALLASQSSRRKDDSSPPAAVTKNDIVVTTPLSAEEKQVAGATVAILVNFMAVLHETDSTSLLRRTDEVQKYCFYLFKRMTATQRDKLSRMVVGKFYETPTFCYTHSFKKYLAQVIEGMRFLNYRIYTKRLEEHKAKWKEAEEEAAAQAKAEAARNAKPLSKKELRDIEKSKKKSQRQIDNAQRAETSHQRKMLYSMIQSNQISDIFAARSAGVGGVDAKAAKWGSEERSDVAAAGAVLDSFTNKNV